METGVNITAVVVANGLGIVLLLVTLIGNKWTLEDRSNETRIISVMVAIALVSCIADPLTSIFMGTPGALSYFIVFAGNWWLFFTNLILGPAWVLLIMSHLHIPISKARKTLMASIDVVCLIPLLVNVFAPVIFSVDANNIYHREYLYWLYVIVQAFFILDGVVIHILSTLRGSRLHFFNIGLFCVPVVIGLVAQSLFYGISTIWPSVAIAVSGIMTGLQNERVFRDKLTGLYNRAYLDYLTSKMSASSNKKGGVMAAMMLDVNSFKSINDQLGHSVGDQALVDTGQILLNAVADKGTVIRWAGDEFVIVLNTQDQAEVEEYVRTIRKETSLFNMVRDRPYTLAFSIGSAIVDFGKQSVGDIMNEIDHRMYEDKKAYYATHDRRAATRTPRKQ